MHNAAPSLAYAVVTARILYNRVVTMCFLFLPLVEPLVHDLCDLIVDLARSALSVV